MKNILLGVTGSIAAYKAAELANALVKQGCGVRVILTENAAKFITPLTFQTLTKNKVYTGMFDDPFQADVEHVSLAKWTDVCLVAPATANLLGKLASGIADDMLSTVLMTIHGLGNTPVVLCPAMNTAMYEDSIVQNNIHKLLAHGYRFVEPKESILACGDLGKGALADIDTILKALEES